MCGIFFTYSRHGYIEPDEATEKALQARGPDSLKTHHVRIETSNLIDDCYLTFVSSVLSLRGDHICVQPLVDPSTGSVLCWNGEAWRIDEVPVLGNDTKRIFELLLATSNAATNDLGPYDLYQDELLKVLTRVTGPYAFVYYDATNLAIWYGRDRLGRRSLVSDTSAATQCELVISSIGINKSPATEVATDGIHCLNLKSSAKLTSTIPWPPSAVFTNNETPIPDQHLCTTPSPEAVAALSEHLVESIRLRVLDVPTYTITQKETLYESPSRVAILFSGGLDCTILARLTHDVLPTDQPIDLLNVAFENPRTIQAAKRHIHKSASTNLNHSPYETCPDRITARSSFAELSSTCPTRVWRFVSIDVPYAETLAHRQTVIELMAPHNTEMDLSITLALYFASRSRGEAITSTSTSPKPTAYTTTSRVLLSGLGADELFGGYARHAAAFSCASWAGLTTELELDFTRIGTRNLGRDDRVMAHWGREVRYPYLDEDFVAFALRLPAWEKVGFRPGRAIPKHFEGGGERITVEREVDLDPAKMVLRIMAWRAGMRRAAGEKKRAIQFGARTAKMEGGRTKGTDLLTPE